MKFRLNLAGVPVDVTTQYDEYYPYFLPYLEKYRDIPPYPALSRQ